MQPITLYSHQYGPNPWKVALIMEELQIPYTTTFVNFADVKKEPYTLINPNGRLPAIHDPNTDLHLWESGAITEYLIEKYDVDHKISPAGCAEKYHAKQWLYFQVSGQAPYYGQASWFIKFHPEKVQSAIERYQKEIHRVCGVLESVLQKQDWLVGDKCTYADLCFVAWQRFAPRFGGEGLYEKFPKVGAWMKRMEARETVAKVYADQDRAIAEVEGKK
ncbi:glutathione S- transferase, nitrogen catabolite repression regulator [Aspergillus melleus]|uniref:Glutathione S- transferase, nitrogen catabolite repression regulator n=1 Tax=Aspergillus melleus TaxID=138277 RepID=A0ACC3BH54_9EURO|nr:glutathione S- transferase, nitrogen catabolite repression regulator [Aspergillus melleus]